MKDKIWLDIDLRLFDGAVGITGEGATQTGPAVAGQGKATGDRGKEGAPAAEGQSETQRKQERRKRYQELINGEFKDFYTQDTQNIIDRRFKTTKELERRVGKSQPILDLLMERYGIGDGDMEKLRKAIDADNAYWAGAAKEAGMSVEQYRRLQRLRRENRDFLDAQRQRRVREKAEVQLRQWYGEGEKLQKLYPGFDLSAEVREPRFLALLKSGIPLRHAYEVVHMDAIKAGVAEMAAKSMEKQVVAAIRARGVRPAENGTAAQSGFTVKGDVSKLTKKDRAEIARRVARGETIKF